MKIGSFDDYRIGLVEGDQLYDVTAVVPAGIDAFPQQRLNWLIANWDSVQEELKRCRAASLPDRKSVV